MFLVHVDDTNTVTDCRVGTKDQWAIAVRTDPTLKFIDRDSFWLRSEVGPFIRNPNHYFIDDLGFLRRDPTL